MAHSVLEVSDLTVRFPGSSAPAVNGVTFSLSQGEIVALIGESGAGKTTLVRAIAGRLASSAQVSGHASLLGFDLLNTRLATSKSAASPKIALIPQEPEAVLNPALRVGQQVDEVLRASQVLSSAERKRRALEVLSLTGLSAEVAIAYPHQLSGGQRQRVVVAQALSLQPALLIADESTSALDNIVQAEILQVLYKLTHRLKLAMLFVTHDAILLPDFTERTLVLHNGAVVESGLTDQVFRKPVHSQTRRIFEAIPRLPETSETAAPRIYVRDRDVVAEVKNLRKTYIAGRSLALRRHPVTALDAASLTLTRGSILGLVGRSGSGKSTLARCLALIEVPDSGEVRIEGQALGSLPRKMEKQFRRRVQLVWQHSALALNPRLPVSEIVAEPALICRELTHADCYRLASEVMSDLGLSDAIARRTVSEISGGQRQRVALARALVLGPSILVLDEVFAGLDLPVQQEISATLHDLKSSKRLAILLITHDLRRAASIADEIAVIDHGRIVEQAEPGQLFWSPQHPASQALVRATAMSRT